MVCSQDNKEGEASPPTSKWTVHIEVRVSPRTTARFDSIRNSVFSYITSSFDRISLPSTLEGWEDDSDLASSVERIVASESSCPFSSLSLEEMLLQIHIYQPCDSDSFEEFSNDGGGGADGEEVMAATVCELPNRNWEGLWDSLVYADNIKLKLLDYIHATFVLSDANVDFNLISWNRVVLLHGPPGTGKTSLCRALAQKLSIRLSHRYSHARLLEINSHSLFSRWFSESGKLVQRLFRSITELVEDEDMFVVVLIDEVESLTAARAGAMAGTEPSDGLRVVNALLTQLDKLKHRKNALVMSTSNLVKAIDCAFVDRADIIQYVDLPSREAIYEVLRTCLVEVVNKGIINAVNVPTLKEAKMYELSATLTPISTYDDRSSKTRRLALKMMELAGHCRSQGLSGRALRRLPVLALAKYIGSGIALGNMSLSDPHLRTPPKTHMTNGHAQTTTSTGGADVEVWIDGIERVIKERATEHGRLL